MSKNRLGKLLKRLSKKSKIKKQIDINKAREGLSLNKISKTMRVLNRLWREQKDDPTNFSKSRQVILKRAMKRAMEEVALVYKIPLVKARKKIKTALKK